MGPERPVHPQLRTIHAGNASPLTLDGTRTFVVGERTPAIIDPGPALDEHMDAVTELIGDSATASILITHAHPDHSDAAEPLAARLHAAVRAFELDTLRDGDVIRTDAGALVALYTPGHRPDHFAFHWPDAGVVFCGDLMMGGQNTALVATPEGNLTDYLASLEKLRTLGARTFYPTHGPAFDDPAAAIDRYIAHRAEREAQVLAALAAGAANEDDILDRVYGTTLAPELRGAARGATRAYLEHLERTGQVARAHAGSWIRT